MTLDWLSIHSPALVVAIPLIAAFATLLISKLAGPKARNGFVVTTLVLELIIGILLARYVLLKGTTVYVFGGVSPAATLAGYTVPVRIMFEVDAFSATMALVSIGLAFLAGIYSLSYMKAHTGLDKYYTLSFLLLAGMLGMVCTGDLFNFFVFLEITSIAGSALVAFFMHRGEAPEAAYKYMTICTVGGLLVLFATALFYSEYDALNIAYLASVLKFGVVEQVALALLLGALAMKAGSFPLHQWLPDAYSEAPCPITIMLVGSTLASLYALFRVCFTLYGGVLNTLIIGWLVIILGVLSIFVGVTMALLQTDFKRLLAYSAISQIGYMLLALGVGLAVLSDPLAMDTYGMRAMEGGIFHLINDATCKALLFLAVGAVFYATKTRDLNKLSGLGRNLKYTSVFFIIGALGLAGMPPCNGFVSKLIIYESVYQFNPVLSIIAILASIVTLAILVKVFYSAFLGPRVEEYKNIEEAPKSMLIPMALLAIVIIIFGLFPDIVLGKLVTPAVHALVDQLSYITRVVPL
ncbi:MAG: proton-conducting transporter membrane subunit [Candidatus Thermoplasmatota archaeon]|nr:proton-conducting transporter membrane subunit [Candidatus Thermoplasmatota archaeon]